MKSILLSTRPGWCEKIASGEKTIEVRKTKPSIPTPFKVLIYQTRKPVLVGFSGTGRHISEYDKTCYYHKGSGKVIGEFVCDKVISTCGWRLRGDTQQCAKRTALEEEFPRLACLTIDELVQYAGGDGRGIYGWHISDLKIYDKPKELSEFKRPCSYKGICYSCDRFVPNGSGDRNFRFCNTKITRPPQSWCYVQELEERK